MSDAGRSPFGRSLRLPGPIEIVDRALFVARALPPSSLLRAWLAAGLPALAVIAVYVLERVEGVRSARPLLACMLVGALLGRALLLVSVARAAAAEQGIVDPQAASRVDVLRLASIVLFGTWLWAWPLVALAKLSPLALPFALPLLSLRALGAPSWLARVACGERGGLAAYRAAFRDLDGVRGAFIVAELLGVLGALGLFANVFALLALGLLLGHSLLGLDVAFTSAFMSPDNPFVLLVVAAVTFVLFEPFRVAMSALAYVGGVTRREGGDLERAVEDVIAAQRARAGRGAVGVVIALLMAAAISVSPVAAQGTSPSAAETAEVQPDDERVRARVEEILARPEFAELAETDQSTIARMIERWLRQLKEYFKTQPEPDSAQPDFAFGSPDPWVVLAIGVTLFLLGAIYVVRARRAQALTPSDPEGPMLLRIDPSARPARLLDDADSLAARGDFAAALRALYVATIVSLDRQGRIRFEPATTNWQYQRALPRGEVRRSFAELTRVFDRKHYGREPTSADEFAFCRGLAESLCRESIAPRVVRGEGIA